MYYYGQGCFQHTETRSTSLSTARRECVVVREEVCVGCAACLRPYYFV